jgi:hypothetical protein
LAQEHIVAVGLLTNRDLERLGSGFKRCFPVSDDGKFEDLLRAIDAADAAALRAGRADGPDAKTMPSLRQS